MELTDLEREVVLRLAAEGPLSGYDFHLGGKRNRGVRTALMSSSYWLTLKEKLGSKGKNLITPVEFRGVSYNGRGRRRDLVWLTDDGLIAAIKNGTKSDSLLKIVKKVYPKDNRKALLVELSNLVEDKEFYADAYYKTKNVENILPAILIASSEAAKTGELDRRFLGKARILKKYPNIHKRTFQVIMMNIKILRRFIQISKRC